MVPRSEGKEQDTLAAIWLFFSSLAIEHMSVGSVWNNVIVAVIVFALSFVGRYGEGPDRAPRHRADIGARSSTSI